MSKFVLNEPRGQYLFEIYTSSSYVQVASYTSHTLPCLNIKHLAVKITSKDQQTLIEVLCIAAENVLFFQVTYIYFKLRTFERVGRFSISLLIQFLILVK